MTVNLWLLCSSLYFAIADARINATSAIDVFWISDCAACVKDGNSIFCSSADSDDNFVRNTSSAVTIRMKKALLGPSDGGKYCWAGALIAAPRLFFRSSSSHFDALIPPSTTFLSRIKARGAAF
jgi:hypothetical protein